MGTSISQHSPGTTNWSPVSACYENKYIPESRLINEIWRASENEALPISKELKSQIIYDCYSAVRNSGTFEQALEKFNRAVLENKSNSIVAEFARRSVIQSFETNKPAHTWASRFFGEITNYIISRDASGFVGKEYRNKTVSELSAFKRRVLSKVVDVINRNPGTITSKSQWNSFVDASIQNLKSVTPE